MKSMSFQHINKVKVEKFMLDNFLQKSYNIFTVRQGETSERKISERNLKKGLTNLRDSDIILKLSREGD
jgi:hypothetical protein